MTDLYLPTPSSSRRRPLAVLTLSVVIAATMIAGVAGVVALTGQDSNTPQDAVNGLLTAAGNGDVIGVLDHLDPAERDAIAGPLSQATTELKRLGVLSPAADLSKIGGLQAGFTGLTFATESLRPGLTSVRITGGTFHGHFDVRQLPLGPFVTSTAGASLSTATATDSTTDLGRPGLHLPALVTVRDGGVWYVSLGYTLAEAARASSHEPLPAPAESVPALGADSPSGAVDAFLHAAATFDVRRLISLTPPDEMAALHDYAPLFLPQVTQAVDRLHQSDHSPTVTITDLGLSAHSMSGGQLVKIDRVGLRIVTGKVTIDYRSGSKCVTVTGATGSTTNVPGICGATTESNNTSGGLGLGSLTGSLQQLLGSHPDLGIVAVQRGGAWYVSPLRTGLDNLAAILHALKTDSLQTITKGGGLSYLLGFGALTGLLGTTNSTRFACVGSSLSATGPSVPTTGNCGVAPPTGRIISGAPVPIGASPLHVITGPCVNGVRAITFSGVSPTKAPQTPITIPCSPTPIGSSGTP